MKTKFYTHKDQKFLGVPGYYDEYGAPYLIEIAENGHYRYIWEDRQGEWRKKKDRDHAHYIKKGYWLEVPELPEKPWKW